jgi:hypothetical protein
MSDVQLISIYYRHILFHADSTLTLVQLMLDVVLYVLI